MFSMPENVAGTAPTGLFGDVIDTQWSSAVAELAAVDGRVRTRQAAGRITTSDTRAARRATRRVLREHTPTGPTPACNFCSGTPYRCLTVYHHLARSKRRWYNVKWNL